MKKELRAVDLAFAAGKKRKSGETGFVHADETIPLYENFCFVLALFAQKTAESVLEGKALLEKLLPFQAGGSFPVFLHEYPKCHDYQMPLRVGAIFKLLLMGFTPVLGADLVGRLEAFLAGLQPNEKPFWQNRYRALTQQVVEPMDTAGFSPLEWADWILTCQLAGITHFTLPYDPELQLFCGHRNLQERGEPKPNAVEWLLGAPNYTPRLLQDHPHQLLAAPLQSLTYDSVALPSNAIYWQGHQKIHSLYMPKDLIQLQGEPETGTFETKIFCSAKDTQVFVGGRKATVFQLGDIVTIRTTTREIDLRFEKIEGEGDFCGHICKANRPTQGVVDEAYDWQIGLRTLRRGSIVKIQICQEARILSIDLKNERESLVPAVC